MSQAMRKALQNYESAKSKPAGEGSRFKAMTAVAKAGGARNPEAVAAAIGRKKYGASGMAALAAKGRRG